MSIKAMDDGLIMAGKLWRKRSLLEDQDLRFIEAIAGGDARALEEIYQRYGPRLLSYLSTRLRDRGLAEEVLQDVMLAAWQSARSFRGECRVYTWLLTIARNRAINAYHRQLVPHSTSILVEDPEISIPGTHTRNMEQVGQYDELHNALQALPDEQLEILELVFSYGLSLEETAYVLKIPNGTVKSRLHRAKQRLKALIGTGYEKDE